MHILLKEDEIAYLVGRSGTIAMAKTRGNFFYLETDDEMEVADETFCTKK